METGSAAQGDIRDVRVESVAVSVFVFPTEEPESDGTLEWDSTTLVLVEISGGGSVGLGYSYTHEAAAVVIQTTLAPLIQGQPVEAHPALWSRMIGAVRNVGLDGVVAAAISAVDLGLWDLRAKLFGLPLVKWLGRAREAVPVYGSGGFTSYSEGVLCAQLRGWVEQGIGEVKMKVGRQKKADLARVAAARAAIGDDASLMVDANNAYSAREAVDWAHRFADEGDVTWLEQPIPQEAVADMAFIREQAPPRMTIADGEYGYTPSWFAGRVRAGAADVFMPDVTRCLGLTGFMKIASVCEAAGFPISTHCAPALHATASCVVSGVCHCEYFFDHSRIERHIFEGAPVPDAEGLMAPSRSRAGFGLALDRQAAQSMAARTYTWEAG